MNEIQKKVNDVFTDNFGYTPLKERLNDIDREAYELRRSTDILNTKEEAGDLLASLIQLHTESGWDIEENVQKTLDKIQSRHLQYKSLGRKTKVAILGGAFNPITKGHIQLAQFVLNTSGEFDEVWLMPANSHMYNKQMESTEDRLAMCEYAAEVDGRIKVFDYEIRNNLAGETYNFFKRLKTEDDLMERFNFSMIIGIDNANTFDKWVNYRELEQLARFVIVPRKGVDRNPDVTWYLKEPHIFLSGDTNIMEVSSTMVREGVRTVSDDTVNEWLHPKVLKHIVDNNLYNKYSI